MNRVVAAWRGILAEMLVFPWPKMNMPEKIGGTKYDRGFHLIIWWYAWILSLAGIVGIGFYAPYWVEQFIVPHWPILQEYQEYIIVSLVFLGSLLWQFLFILTSFTLVFPVRNLLRNINKSMIIILYNSLLILFTFVTFLLPFMLTIFLGYWYFSHFAPNHNLVGTGILAATIIKIAVTFVPGIVKSIFTGVVFFRIFTWLRGDANTPLQPRRNDKQEPPAA